MPSGDAIVAEVEKLLLEIKAAEAVDKGSRKRRREESSALAAAGGDAEVEDLSTLIPPKPLPPLSLPAAGATPSRPASSSAASQRQR